MEIEESHYDTVWTWLAPSSANLSPLNRLLATRLGQ